MGSQTRFPLAFMDSRLRGNDKQGEVAGIISMRASKNGRNHDHASAAAFGALTSVEKLRNFTAVLRQVRDQSEEYRQLVTNYCDSQNISIQ